MSTTAGRPVQEVLADAWAVRYRIETEACLRFGALARRLDTATAPRVLIELAERASQDETRHAAHCERFFRALGGKTLQGVTHVVEYAPPTLPEAAVDKTPLEISGRCPTHSSYRCQVE